MRHELDTPSPDAVSPRFLQINGRNRALKERINGSFSPQEPTGRGPRRKTGMNPLRVRLKKSVHLVEELAEAW